MAVIIDYNCIKKYIKDRIDVSKPIEELT